MDFCRTRMKVEWVSIAFVTLLVACDHVNVLSPVESAGNNIEEIDTDDYVINYDGSTVAFDGEANGSLIAGHIVGDIDGDGFDDFILTDYQVTNPATEVRGATYLFYGRESFEPTLSVMDADAVLRGSGNNYENNRICDVNGDGFKDFTIPGWDGEAHLIYGRSERLTGESLASDVAVTLKATIAEQDPSLLSSEMELRTSVITGCLGDLSGDGIDDIFFTSVQPIRILNEDGVTIEDKSLINTYILFGRAIDFPSVVELEDADVHISGAADGFGLNGGAASPGDIDDDGFNDLLIGVENETRTAFKTLLYYGGADRFPKEMSPTAADAVFEWEAQWSNMGSLGDINADGLDDFGLVSPVIEDNRLDVIYGRENRFSGTVDRSVVNLSIKSAATGDNSQLLGLSHGDFDADGLEDMMIGDPHNNQNGPQSGALFVVLGRTIDDNDEILLSEFNALQYGVSDIDEVAYVDMSETLGVGVASGGDVNGDGVDDIIVGAPGCAIGDEFGGRVYLHLAESAE